MGNCLCLARPSPTNDAGLLMRNDDVPGSPAVEPVDKKPTTSRAPNTDAQTSVVSPGGDDVASVQRNLNANLISAAAAPIPQFAGAPILIEEPIGGSLDAETRKKRRKQARDEARAKAARNHHAPLVDVRPPHTVTIYPIDEPAIPTQIEVSRQLKYTGTSHVIPSSLASVSCISLGVARLLDQLNDVLGTSFTLDTPSLAIHLEECILRGYDFGTAYGRLRPRWYSDFTTLQKKLADCEAEDQKMRDDALDKLKNQISMPQLRPRRVWDLYSNRVLPMWIIRRDPWALSHSWMDIKLRNNVNTPINTYEWPVPIPNDTTLEHVRIELLNLEAEYVWLDVLCLRQKGRSEDEALRAEEWKLDVPTIGNVYHQNQKVVHYFSGLGRPFRIGNLDSPRHWINRAWTLQEISENRIPAGEAVDSPIMPVVDEDGRYEDPNVGRFYTQLASLQAFAQEADNIFPILSSMRNRSAESDLDKIAGLAYLLRSRVLPAYIATQTVEDAWTHLIESVNERYRGDLLFLYPAPGSGHQIWAPSWDQIRTTKLPSPGGVYLFEQVTRLEKDGIYQHRGYCIDRCLVQGLAKEGVDDDGARHGRLAVKDSIGTTHEFEVIAFHRHSIPEGELCVVGTQGLEYWVVGRFNEEGHVRKISVLRMPSSKDRERLRQLELGCSKDNRYV